VYYVICKFISPPTSAQVIEAVYPPGINDDILPVSGTNTPEKDGSIVKVINETV
jgi:hypothetical protein